MLDNQFRGQRGLLSKCASRLILFGTLTALLLGLAGCSSTRPPQTVLRFPLYGSLGNPDPALASTAAGTFLDSLLYTGLVKYGPDLHVVPELAVSLPTISSSGLVYTFTIRQDCRFADGRHCTASDAAYSLARPLTPAVHSRRAWSYFHDIKGARAVWDGSSARLAGVSVVHRLTIRIRLQTPDADFLEELADPAGAVIEAAGNQGAKIVDWNGTDRGTGPWTISARYRDGSLLLSPRRHFYGARLQVRSLSLIPVPTVAAGLNLYHQGALDVALIPNTRYEKLSKSPDFHSSPGLDAYYAVPSSPVPVLNADLNRNRLTQQTSPALTPLTTIVPPAVPDYVPSSVQPDPSLKRESIAAISVQKGQSMETLLRSTLLHQSGPPTRRAVELRLIHVWQPLPDPSSWLRLVLPETRSPWLRHLLAHAGKLTNDPVTRMATYSRCEAWVLQQGFIVPLASGSVAYLIKPAVQNLQVTPFGLMPANNSWATVTLG